MNKKIEPLSYAIMKLFRDGKARSVAGVVNELEPLYGGHRLLNEKDVDEALATAKENGLLDESRAEVDEGGTLRIFYTINDYGQGMVEKYL